MCAIYRTLSLNNPKLNIDNNPAERLNRGIALLRKNCLLPEAKKADRICPSFIPSPPHARQTSFRSGNGSKMSCLV